jgi:hypothetical protein
MQRNVLVDAVANDGSADAATFASLPLPLAHRIFLALPVDARVRACCVCRAWRDALASPSLWTRLDLSDVRVEGRRFDSVLVGAAARGRGMLCVLDLSQQHVPRDVLLPVLAANAGSLRELHLSVVYSNFYSARSTVKAVVAAAPLLQVLTVGSVICSWEDAPRVLRAEPPYALLHIRSLLWVKGRIAAGRSGGMERFGPFAAALADAALQPALLRLCVEHADLALPDWMGALVDAALARRLRELTLQFCTPPPAAPLARLLAEGSLVVLGIRQSHLLHGSRLLDAAGAALVADALRMNTTLTKLALSSARLTSDMRVAGALLGALVGHPSLRMLQIIEENTMKDDRSAFGAALAALIAADTPLWKLVCSDNSLEDDGLAPIVEALPLNRHLRELDMGFNDVSEDFARERLLPAVRVFFTCRCRCSGVTATIRSRQLRRRRRSWCAAGRSTTDAPRAEGVKAQRASVIESTASPLRAMKCV